MKYKKLLIGVVLFVVVLVLAHSIFQNELVYRGVESFFCLPIVYFSYGDLTVDKKLLNVLFFSSIFLNSLLFTPELGNIQYIFVNVVCTVISYLLLLSLEKYKK